MHVNLKLVNPAHPITIIVAGCGGTGSHVLNALASMNLALLERKHKGIRVMAFDDAMVNNWNPLRQAFYPSDVGKYKALACIEKINNFYGFDWVAYPTKMTREVRNTNFRTGVGLVPEGFLISCVDSGIARAEIALSWKHYPDKFYWIDTGNGFDFGQIIMASQGVKQPENTRKIKYTKTLPSILDLHPALATVERTTSCSGIESLQWQDLFINRQIATYTIDFLWKFITKGYTNHQGLYLNFSKNEIREIPC